MKELQLDRKKMTLIALVLMPVNWLSMAMAFQGKIAMLVVTGAITLAFYYMGGCLPAFISAVMAVAKIGAAIGGALGALTAWMMGIGFLIMIIAQVGSVMIVGYAGVVLAYLFPIVMYPFLCWLGKRMYGFDNADYIVKLGEKKKQKNKASEEVNWDNVYSKVMNEVKNN